MLTISASVTPSPIQGLGCDTDEAINKGTIVWVFDERLDLRLPEAELAAWPAAIQEFLQLWAYRVTEVGQKVLILCSNHARPINHSETPNLAGWSPHLAMDMAVRDIEAGEALTCNYHKFDLDGRGKLAPSRAQARLAQPRSIIESEISELSGMIHAVNSCSSAKFTTEM